MFTSILFSLAIALVPFLNYFFNYKLALKVTGKYNFIEFSLDRLSQSSLNEFLGKIEIESSKQKNYKK